MRQSILTVILLCAIGAALLSAGACSPARDYQAEARIVADAQVQAARLAADAEVQSTAIEATEATKRNTAVVSVLPILLLIVGGVGFVWLVVWFRGKRELLVVTALMQIPEAVTAEAMRRRLIPQRVGDSWMLVDETGVPRIKMREIDAEQPARLTG